MFETLTPGHVAFDGGPAVPALLAPDHWNGWAMPLVRVSDLATLWACALGETQESRFVDEGGSIRHVMGFGGDRTDAVRYPVRTDADGQRWADMRDEGYTFNFVADPVEWAALDWG